MKKLVFLLLALPLLGIVHERWSEKTASDADASLIPAVPVRTTVEEMISWPPPPSPPEHRLAPHETTLYQVEVSLIGAKLERDGDYHLVIAGASGATMIAEIPGSDAVAGSLFRKKILAARAEFEKNVSPPTARFKKINARLRITGPALFDHPHGQTGVAKNAIEIHPVVKIEFIPLG